MIGHNRLHKHPNAQAAEQGFVLVIVLWVLAILSVVTIGIGRQAWLDRQAAAYSLDHTQALMQARGAVHRAAVELRNKTLKDFARAESEDAFGRNPSTHLGQEWARPTNLLVESEYFTESGETFANDVVEFRIRDLEGKFNVNIIPVSLMEKMDGLDRRTIRKIEFRRKGNPETGDAPMLFNTIEELRYFEGVSEDDWFGTRRQPGLPQYLTVWGDQRININTALPEALEVVPGLDSRAVRAILDYRAGPDGELFTEDDWGFRNFEELWNVIGVEGEAQQALRNNVKLDSNFFEITGIATRRGGKIRAKITAVIDMGRLLNVQFRDNDFDIPPSPYISWSEETIGS